MKTRRGTSQKHWHLRRGVFWLFGCLSGGLVILFSLSACGLLPGSRLNCTRQDIDISSGRIRYTRYIAFLPLKRNVSDSAITAALQRNDFHYLRADWKQARTLSPGIIGTWPDDIFHASLQEITEIERIWDIGKFTGPARRQTAKEILKFWQSGSGDTTARKYLDQLWEIAGDNRSHGKVTNEDDLPVVLK